MEQKKVCVYCAASSDVNPVYLDAAFELGRELARAGYGLITGGGKFGLMRRVEDGAFQAGGSVTGIIPQFMIDKGWLNPEIHDIVVTNGMHERKRLMAEMASAAITLPGGIGTLDELAEIIDWKKLGLFTKPLVILNTAGYYDLVLAHLERMISENFMAPTVRPLWGVASEPAEAIRLLDTNF